MDIADFLITKEYRRFEEFSNACFRDKYIGICHGVPGVGKTISARYYSKYDYFQKLGNNDLSEKESLEISKQLIASRTIFYTAPVTNTPNRIEIDLNKERLKLFSNLHQAKKTVLKTSVGYTEDTSALVIIDEADRLKMNTLEQVRDMYDRNGNWGVILIGMQGIEKRLARYPQLYSRVGFSHEYRSIGEEEMFFILEHHWSKLGLALDRKNFSDTEAVATVARATNGNFRLIHRLFSQIKRILKVNELTSISKEVVVAAQKCLVIGNV